jgi:polysaccharide biosynthesis/export protein
MLYFLGFRKVSIHLRSIFKPHLHLSTFSSEVRFSWVTGLGIILAVSAIVLFSLRASAQTTANPQTHPAGNTSTFPSPSFSNASPEAGTALPATTAATPSADQSQYIISAGDVLDISVFGASDLSQKAVVNRAGKVYMPLISYVSVAGMHVEDAQTTIEHAYLTDGILKSPHVSVAIASYASGIVLMGEVSRPGIYPIVGAGKLFDILAEAGGPTTSAGQVVTITHKNSTEPQIVMLTNDPVKSLAANVFVQQGDTIIVSKAGVVYIVGEVNTPSGFLMDEKDQYTVMKVVAMAHGTTKLAKTSKARIVRRTSEGNKEIPVPLDKILVSKAPDMPLQANDILFVPTNKGKEAAARGAEAAIGLATGAAIIGFERW